jgi:hypothetical protein
VLASSLPGRATLKTFLVTLRQSLTLVGTFAELRQPQIRTSRSPPVVLSQLPPASQRCGNFKQTRHPVRLDFDRIETGSRRHARAR